MANEPVQFEIKPTVEELKKRHERKLSELKDMKKAYAKVASYLDRWVQTNFKTEGGKVGGWIPFALGGRWVKGKGLDTSAKLLQDTGRLKASFLPFSFKNNAGIGSNVEYSKKHEEGDGVPERRILPVKKEVINDTKKILDSEVARITKL